MQRKTHVYACGFNAHGQLDFATVPPASSPSSLTCSPSTLPLSTSSTSNRDAEKQDVYEFRFMVEGSGRGTGHGSGMAGGVEIVWAGWSQTVVLLNNTFHLLGHNPSLIHIHQPTPLPTAFFGDHNGLTGTLSPSGLLHNLTHLPLTDSSPSLLPSTPDSPPLSHIAITAANRVAVTFVAAPASSAIHICEFATLPSFLAWHADPSNPLLAPTAHHMVAGRVKGLVANAVGFVLWTQAGEAYTWGDERYGGVLGRGVGGEAEAGAADAGTPGRVEGLVGLRVVKVVAGGWMAGAVTEWGDGFLWGGVEPGGDGEVIEELEGVVGEVARVEVPGMGAGGDLEVVDMAIGAGHVLVLDSRGSVWCAGKGSNGQLGLGRTSVEFVKVWQRVPGLERLKEKGLHVKNVVCGDLTSFAVAINAE